MFFLQKNLFRTTTPPPCPTRTRPTSAPAASAAATAAAAAAAAATAAAAARSGQTRSTTGTCPKSANTRQRRTASRYHHITCDVAWNLSSEVFFWLGEVLDTCFWCCCCLYFCCCCCCCAVSDVFVFVTLSIVLYFKSDFFLISHIFSYPHVRRSSVALTSPTPTARPSTAQSARRNRAKSATRDTTQSVTGWGTCNSFPNKKWLFSENCYFSQRCRRRSVTLNMTRIVTGSPTRSATPTTRRSAGQSTGTSNTNTHMNFPKKMLLLFFPGRWSDTRRRTTATGRRATWGTSLANEGRIRNIDSEYLLWEIIYRYKTYT